MIFKKDLRLELRTGESLVAMILFSVGVILLFSFALPMTPQVSSSLAPGLLWMTYFFAAVMGLFRSFSREHELEAYALLLSSPLERSSIYLGKLAAFVLFLIITQAASLPLFALFLNLPLWSAPGQVAVVVILADLAIGAVGILVGGLSRRSPLGEALLPILLFPLLAPILIAATKATRMVLDGMPLAAWDVWLMILITFLVAFGLVGAFIFDYISEE